MSQWQACPVCGGRGSVPAGFYPWSGMLDIGQQCRTCNGSGMVGEDGHGAPTVQPSEPSEEAVEHSDAQGSGEVVSPWEKRWRMLVGEAGHTALSMFDDDRPFGERLLALASKIEEKVPVGPPTEDEGGES